MKKYRLANRYLDDLVENCSNELSVTLRQELSSQSNLCRGGLESYAVEQVRGSALGGA